MSNIKATIPTYEELTDSDGKIYTVGKKGCLRAPIGQVHPINTWALLQVYNVFVEEKKTSMRWLLRKRYRQAIDIYCPFDDISLI